MKHIPSDEELVPRIMAAVRGVSVDEYLNSKNIPQKPKMLISFSGGRTSAMMTKWLLDHKSNEYDFLVVFANTGHEREATLEFVNNCDIHFGFNTVWVEAVFSKGGTRAKVVDYNTAYRNIKKNGIDPFEAMIAKHGMPNMNNPHCSRDLKKYAINALCRSIGWKAKTYLTALGIRSDETKRLNWERAKKEMILYFAQLGTITKEMVNKWWSQQPFDLQLKSFEGNCILCWKKSFRKLYTLIIEGIKSNDIEIIAEIAWLQMIQEKYGRYVPATRIKQDKGKEIHMFRGEKSITDLIEESDGFIDFAIDESNLVIDAIQMAMWDNELDGNAGCVESCEAL